MTDIELISAAAQLDSDVVRELIRRFNEAKHKAEIAEIKLNHQFDLVSVLRQTIDIMDGAL